MLNHQTSKNHHSHEPRTMTNRPIAGPIWYDLPAADQSTAKSFYGALFGWTWLEMPTPDEGATYSMAMMGEKHVAAIFTEYPGLRKPDGPMMWMHHFFSHDVEADVKRASDLGGEILIPPYDLPGAGAKAVVTTHEGVPLVLWQSADIFGTDCFGETHAACWTEYYTRDVEGSYRFFDEVLGIRFKKLELEQVVNPGEMYEYHTMLTGGEEERGGMLEMDEQWGDMKPHIMLYFRVDDCEASAKRVEELGGVVCVPPTDIPPGKFSVLNDPQGGTFSVIEMNSDPEQKE